jgi:hypothetical protein
MAQPLKGDLSGFPLLYVDEENISRKLKCVICLAPAINPRVHRGCNTVLCGHCADMLLAREGDTSCPTCRQECSEDSLQANDLIEKLLDEISVFCCNKANGCVWSDERGSLWTHLEQFCERCGCNNHEECDWLGMEKNREDHNEECGYVEVTCPDRCGITLERQYLVDHKRECKIFLEKERQRLTMDILSQCDNLNPAPEEMIKIMVGGKLFVASRTLLTRYPSSVLGVLFSEKERALKRDAEGTVYLDTCGVAFDHLLTWLHQGIVNIDVTNAEFSLLQVEAARWRLQELTEELEQMSRQRDLKHRREKGFVKSEANSNASQPKKKGVQQSADVKNVPEGKEERYVTKVEVKQERRIKPELIEGRVKAKSAADGKAPAKDKPLAKVEGKGQAPKGAKNTSQKKK